VLSHYSHRATCVSLDVLLVVLAEKYGLDVAQADACSEQGPPAPAAQFAHPLMAHHKVLGERKQKDTA
jgi:hypothetical protein